MNSRRPFSTANTRPLTSQCSRWTLAIRFTPTTVDAGGADEHGVRRVAGGNPQTGPFYINGAIPGDTLVVHVNRLRLNRDWAGSDDGIVQTALAPDLAIKTRDNRNSIRWHLDLKANTATPEPASEHLKQFAIPLRPMLGCIAAAPSPAGGAPPTGDSGYYGGNMDFNEIGDGTTVTFRCPIRAHCCISEMHTPCRATANLMAMLSKLEWTSSSRWT